MEMRWLRAFVAVSEELHFGRAARRLGMAQSPLSQMIRKLENDIDAPLFERNTRTVALTAAGRAFAPHAYRILEELDHARRAAHASRGAVYGVVAIGFTGALNSLSLTPLTRAVRQRYPDVTLRLQGRVMTRDAVDQLEQGSLDLAFVGLPLASARLSSRLIRVEPLGAVLPADHPLAGAPELDLADLSREGFVTTPAAAGSTLQEQTLRACVNAGFRPRVVQEISDPYLIMTLVAAGIGVALMPSGIREIVPPGASYVPVRGPQTYMNHGLAWATDNPSTVLRTVLELVDEVLPTAGSLDTPSP